MNKLSRCLLLRKINNTYEIDRNRFYWFIVPVINMRIKTEIYHKITNEVIKRI